MRTNGHARAVTAQRLDLRSVLKRLLFFAVLPLLVPGGADVVEEPIDVPSRPT